MRHNFINAAARLQSSGWGTAARLARPTASDKCVLCELPALILLGFLDTLQTPPKNPRKYGLVSGAVSTSGGTNHH